MFKLTSTICRVPFLPGSDLSCRLVRNQSCKLSYVSHNKIDGSAMDPSKSNQSKASQVFSTPSRKLYMETSLGLSKLDEHAEKLVSGGHDERYKISLFNQISSDNYKLQLESDMYRLISLAENEHHIDLIDKVAANLKYSDLNNRGGWGSALMRKYYSMQLVDRAYLNIMDRETFGNLFNESAVYRVAMTMLYQYGRYEDVVRVYRLADSHLENRMPYSYFRPTLALVVFASLAKINTPEALETAEQLYKDLSLISTINVRARSLAFISYLAVSNNQPARAINWTRQYLIDYSTQVRAVTALAWLKMKRHADLLVYLKRNLVGKADKTIPREVLDAIKNDDEVIDPDIKSDILDVISELEKGDNISDEGFEAVIFRQVKYISPLYALNYPMVSRKASHSGDLKVSITNDDKSDQSRTEIRTPRRNTKPKVYIETENSYPLTSKRFDNSFNNGLSESNRDEQKRTRQSSSQEVTDSRAKRFDQDITLKSNSVDDISVQDDIFLDPDFIIDDEYLSNPPKSPDERTKDAKSETTNYRKKLR